MIIGIGSDLVDIGRIEKILEDHGQRFIQRCFSVEEIQKAEQGREKGTVIDIYAKRWAAKEACAKALGTGIDEGVFLKDISVINDEKGRPSLILTGGAQKQLDRLLPSGMKAIIHLTLTDEPPMAQAFVIIEAVAKESFSGKERGD